MKTFKKTKIFAVLILLAVFALPVSAVQTDEYYEAQLQASGADGLSDILPDEAKEYMSAAGVDTLDFRTLLDFSPKAIIDVFVMMIKDGIAQPLRAFAVCTGNLLLLAAAQSVFTGDAKSRNVLNIISGCFLIIGIFTHLYTAVKAGISCISLTAAFELALIPVYAAVVTASGNPALALSYSGASLLAAQGVERLAKSVILPASTACLSLGITASLSPDFRLGSLCETLTKTVKSILSFAAAMFSSFLALKGLLARSADGLAAKGIRLAVSSAVPVVGGALSEAYSTVAGSLELLNSAVGAFGIAAVFMINAPSVVSLFMWIVALRLGETVAKIMGQEQQASLIKCIADTVSMINILVIYCMTVFIISCGIVLALRTES